MDALVDRPMTTQELSLGSEASPVLSAQIVGICYAKMLAASLSKGLLEDRVFEEVRQGRYRVYYGILRLARGAA